MEQDVTRPGRRRTGSVLLGVLAVGLSMSGCGAASGAKAAATVTVTVTATPSDTSTDTPTPSGSASPSDSASASASDSSGPSDSSSPSISLGPTGTGTPSDSSSPVAGGTPSPGTVSTARAGQPLGLSDAQSSTGNWEENRYEIADRSNVRGMGVPVTGCGDRQEGDVGLEYRLANRFQKLTMSVSQANTSPQSDQGLTVAVIANGTQRDIETVPFNQVKPIPLDISGVNALQIRLFLDDKNKACNSRGVIAVVEQLVVS